MHISITDHRSPIPLCCVKDALCRLAFLHALPSYVTYVVKNGVWSFCTSM